MIDSAAALCVLAGLAIGVLTWQASRSGEVSWQFGRLRRELSPGGFRIVLVARALLGLVLAAVGIWGIFGGGRPG